MSNYSNFTADDYTHCPKCKSTNLLRETGENIPGNQYGRLRCGNCGKHLQWLRDPSVDLETAARDREIDKLLGDDPRFSLNA